jgi:hypothetical protein
LSRTQTQYDFYLGTQLEHTYEKKEKRIDMNNLDKTKDKINILLFREKHTCVMQKDLSMRFGLDEGRNIRLNHSFLHFLSI